MSLREWCQREGHPLRALLVVPEQLTLMAARCVCGERSRTVRSPLDEDEERRQVIVLPAESIDRQGTGLARENFDQREPNGGNA